MTVPTGQLKDGAIIFARCTTQKKLGTASRRLQFYCTMHYFNADQCFSQKQNMSFQHISDLKILLQSPATFEIDSNIVFYFFETSMNKKQIKALHVRKANAAWKDRNTLQRLPHGLPSRLIVNLTSHPPRYPTLLLTLKCLLTQTVRADRVMLWIASADMATLPEPVLQLVKHGLTIRACEDRLSYNKIVHAIEAFPKAFLVVADDDVYYPPNWLETLVGAFDPGKWEVICHRARAITRDDQGGVRPYLQWNEEIADTAPSALVFPTAGVSGALYRPGILHKDVTRQDLYLELARTTDDIWLYFMSRMTGAVSRKAEGFQPIITWAGSQTTNLVAFNNQGGGNDLCWKRLCDHYGFVPTDLPVRSVPLRQRLAPWRAWFRHLASFDVLARWRAARSKTA